MARIPSVAQPFCSRISPGFSAAGVWKMPSGALRMPSALPVTPISRSALS